MCVFLLQHILSIRLSVVNGSPVAAFSEFVRVYLEDVSQNPLKRSTMCEAGEDWIDIKESPEQKKKEEKKHMGYTLYSVYI